MKKYLNAFKSEIVTNLIIAKNYKFSFLMNIGIFISILSFLILFKSGRNNPHLKLKKSSGGDILGL